LQVFRIGVMGTNARPQCIELVVAAFKDGLKAQGKLKA
jgi:aspartate aminotransferase-like enzyme